MKRCLVCRGTYRGAGRRVLADGRFRLACPRCADRALRVVQSIVTADCACGEVASVCDACAVRAADKAHRIAVEASLERLRAMLAVFKGTVPREEERDFVEGVMDGFERAIEVLQRRS